MRKALMVLCLLLGSAIPAAAQVSIHIGGPEVSIGFSLSSYPQFVRVPGYPVYYAPRLKSNYFFYDGLYWVYRDDNWYASYWYNGPWGRVAPRAVPLYVLRIPVRYYRVRPSHFSGWRVDAPPRWGDLWGDEWQQSRRGWDRWNRSAVPAPAPLPIYQRQYSGSRYPAVEQQPVLQSRYYAYQPREAVVREFYQVQGVQRAQAAPAPAVRQPTPQPRVAPQPTLAPQQLAPREPRTVQQPRVTQQPQQAPQPRAAQQPREPRAVQQPRAPTEPTAMPQRQQPRAGQPPQEPRAVQQPGPGKEPKAERQPQQPRAVQQPQEPRAAPQPQSAREPRAAQQPQQPRAAQQPQESRAGKEPREAKPPKEAKEPKEGKEQKEGKESKGGR